jgi:hypothetical protein
VDQRRAVGVGDAAQCPDHLIGTVFQVAQVVAADRVVRVPGLVKTFPRQQRVGDHVGVPPHFGQHRVVGMPHARHGVERRRPLGLQLVGTAQVHDRGHAEVAHQLGDIGGRQFLQVIRAQQAGPRGLVAILGGQVAQVSHIYRAVKLNPCHDNTFADAPDDAEVGHT